MNQSRRRMGELEAEILAELWSAGRSLTSGEVLAAMPRRLAYNTVTTTLQRLWAKGLVTREQRGRAFVYQPRQSPADLLAHRMLAHMERAGDPQAVLASFVGGLSKQDARTLHHMLAALDADDDA